MTGVRFWVGAAVVAFCGAGAAGAYFGHGKQASAATPRETAPSGSAEDCRATHAEIAELRTQVQQLQARLGVATLGALTAAGNTNAAASSDAPATPPPTPAQEAAWLDARSKFYESFLKSQPRDEAWASAMESHAVEVAKTVHGRGVSLEDVRCWSGRCRLEFSYPDAATRLWHLQTLGQNFPELEQVSYAYPGEPAQTRAVLYMAKSGSPLPDFDYATFTANAR